MGRLIGYARVSTAEQDFELQRAALRSAGCSDPHIFCDTASGTRTARPGLEACVHTLEPGDTLVVWRLDRLGRSMTHLVTLIQALLQRQVSFRSLSDGAIDTTTASGELVFHIFSALAQCERRLIQERTQAGLAVARARGKKGEPYAPPRGGAPRPDSVHHITHTKSRCEENRCGNGTPPPRTTCQRGNPITPGVAALRGGWQLSSGIGGSLSPDWVAGITGIRNHRAIKRVTRPMLGFKAFEAAQATLTGIELTHMLRKGQLTGGKKMGLTVAEQFYALAAYGSPQQRGIQLTVPTRQDLRPNPFNP
jgi:predicted site-specific integrase-resolvase